MPDILSKARLGLASPTLHPGDHLDQRTFHELYAAMPAGFRAELVEGVVMIPFSVSVEHGGDHSLIGTWLSLYSFSTPGTRAVLDTTFILGPKDAPQPDAALIVLPEYGGQTRREGQFAAGAPEFVAEVAYTTFAYDRHSKMRAYEAAGVREYLILNLGAKQVEWFVLRDATFATLQASEDGLFRSETFPGLWRDTTTLIARDGKAVVRALQGGLATPEHAAFAAELVARMRD